MFRSIGAFLVLGVVGYAFTACGPKSNDGETTPPLSNAGASGFGGGGFGAAVVGGGGVNPGGTTGTGSGPIFGNTGGLQGTSGNGGAPEDGGCGEQGYQGEQVPLDIYIMFDQSASMSCTIGTGTRWDAVKAALASFVQNAGATTINVGLGYFGTAASPPGSSCLPSDYRPDVEIGPLAVTGPAIVTSLNAHGPLTDTPTYPALQSAVSHAIQWKAQNPGHTVVVVLVTDGQPNACGANNVSQIVATAKTGFDDGTIPTYVIGIISPGSTCALDPNQPTVADLDSVAAAGGTDKALIVDTTNTAQDPGAQFLATMNQIRQTAQIPCEFAIPKTATGKFETKKVNLVFTDPSGGKGPIYPAPQAPADEVGWVGHEGCATATDGGWYYDKDPNDTKNLPTKIILCKATCDTLTATFGYKVNIKLGCPTIPPPH
jgi:hypothetical protein